MTFDLKGQKLIKVLLLMAANLQNKSSNGKVYIPHPNSNFHNPGGYFAAHKISLYNRDLSNIVHICDRDIRRGNLAGCGYKDLEKINLSKMYSKFEKANPNRRYSIAKGPGDYRTHEFYFLSEDGCIFGIEILPIDNRPSAVYGSCLLDFKLAPNDYLTFDLFWIPVPFVEFLKWLLPQVSDT